MTATSDDELSKLGRPRPAIGGHCAGQCSQVNIILRPPLGVSCEQLEDEEVAGPGDGNTQAFDKFKVLGIADNAILGPARGKQQIDDRRGLVSALKADSGKPRQGIMLHGLDHVPSQRDQPPYERLGVVVVRRDNRQIHVACESRFRTCRDAKASHEREPTVQVEKITADGLEHIEQAHRRGQTPLDPTESP